MEDDKRKPVYNDRRIVLNLSECEEVLKLNIHLLSKETQEKLKLIGIGEENE